MESQSTSRQVTEDGYSEYSAPPPPKKKKTSKVWKELTASTNAQGEPTAICKHCKVALCATSGSGTSHLRRHLERCPSRPSGYVPDELGDDDGPFVFNMSELRKQIMLYIVEGTHSFSIVEEPGFRRMMSKANPNFMPFSRSTTKRDLLSMFFEEREKVKDMVMKAPGRICLTTDNWKSSHTNQHYICVTAHFVDIDWKLQKRILRFRALAPPYDGKSIANEIYLFLSQWGIGDKILSISVDNARYNDVMISFLKRSLTPRNGLVCGGEFFHIRCCAHILNLIVQQGLTMIEETLDKIRGLVKVLLRSSQRSKEFYDNAEKVFHLDVKRKLNLDMQVRWNSTYKMLDNVLYYKDVFVYFLSTDSPLKAHVPLEDEWEKVIAIHRFLMLFYEVTCMFSATKTPTSNLYFKGAWLVHCRLLEATQGPHDYLANMANEMLVKFDKYWAEYNLYLSCATILDPRFKVKFVEYCFTKLLGSSEEVKSRVDSVLDTLRALYNEYLQQPVSVSPMVSSSPLASGLGNEYFQDYNSFQGTASRPQTGKSHLDMYLEELPLDMNLEMDVLKFWHENSVRFPELSAMARDLLTIPVSTVASESAFSLGGKTISSTRSALKPKTVQALVCLQDWRRAEYDAMAAATIDNDSDEETDDEDGTSNYF